MKVAIIHPWFPQYRESLFRDLKEQADLRGIELDIFHGEVPPEWKDRNDTSGSPISTLLKTNFIPLGEKHLAVKSLTPLSPIRKYNLIIVEHAVRNLETYRLLLMARKRVAMWGHGRTYSAKTGRLQESLKNLLATRASWFFAYTESGMRSVSDAGVPADRITVVNNSVDTVSFRQDLGALGTVQSPRAGDYVYIGALDESKRISFLLSAFELARRQNEGIRLTVAGDGSLRDVVKAAARRADWLTYVGRAAGLDKARLFRSAYALAVPGAIGLVAVESLVAGVPIVTTSWPYHGPEMDYLTHGSTSIVTGDSVEEYANALVELTKSSALREDLSRQCILESTRYSSERAAKNMVDGMVLALQASEKK